MQHPASPKSIRPWNRRRLLLADDSLPIRECLTEILAGLGHEVAHASDGQQVLERLASEDFDLVLLDLNMPGLDGWDTLKRLHARHPLLPVVVITAQANQRDWMQAMGARALLEKPLDLPLLGRTIESLIPAHPSALPSGLEGQSLPLQYGRPRRVPVPETEEDPAHAAGAMNE